MNVIELEKEYSQIRASVYPFLDDLKRQFSILLKGESVSFAVPIEGRIKDWASIREKVERKGTSLESIKELNDIVGLRVILLFKKDIDITLRSVEKALNLVEKENKVSSINDDQFGYSSIHCIGYLPDEWLSLPVFSNFNGVKVEIQIRTIAQHLWAAASHLLQYKKEQNIPPELRRSVYRMSALLEVVDLEFDRVLQERELLRNEITTFNEEEKLNVDIVEGLLDEAFPDGNKLPGEENYSLVLEYLRCFNLDTVGMFRTILKIGAPLAMEHEKNIVNGYRYDSLLIDNERIKKGVFYLHSGLALQALAEVLERNEKSEDKSKALYLRKSKSEKRIKDYLDSPTEEERKRIEDFFEPGSIERAIESNGERFGIGKTCRERIENLTRPVK